MKRILLWVAAWMVGVYFNAFLATIFLMSYLGVLFYEWSRRHYIAGYNKGMSMSKEERNAYLENAFDRRTDDLWLGAAAARAETYVLAGVLPPRE